MEKVEVVAESAAVGSGLTKGAPVAIGGAVSGLTIFGVPIPDLVPVLTCIYLVIMIGHTGWKWWSDWRSAKKDQ